MKHLTVSAGILINNNQILCTQRGESKYEYISKKFEFPGGKVESDESTKQAVIREVQEELNIVLYPCRVKEYISVNHNYPDFSITMHTFLCPVKSREMKKTEHLECIWLNKEELNNLDWAPADIPIVEKIMSEKSLSNDIV